MANIESRLLRLEEAIAREHEDSPGAVQAEWCEIGDDGTIVGPLLGVHLTKGQRDTLATIAMMDASIPFR